MMTTSEVLAAATALLSRWYRGAGTASLEKSVADVRLFEDDFGLVALVTFDTWHSLVEEWSDLQGWLVNLISARTSREDPKAWEGYLILMTPQVPPVEATAQLDVIRYNLTHVRKLVGTGDVLRTVSEVEAFLAPMVPLSIEAPLPSLTSVLDVLPNVLDTSDVPPGSLEAVTQAYKQQKPLLAALHDHLGSS